MPYVFNPFTGNFDVSTSPSGVNSEVQYNSNGQFGSDSSFAYDQPNKQLKIDGAASNNTIGNVSSYSLSDAGSGSGYSHDGDYYYWFRVYAYKIIAGSKVYSASPIYASVYFTGGEYQTSILHSITPVSGANGYVIVRSSEESSASQPSNNTFTVYKDIGNDVAYTDDGLGFTYAVSEYIPSPTTLNFVAAPFVVNGTINSSTNSFDVVRFGQDLKLQWQFGESRLAFLNASDAVQTINANVISNTATITTGTFGNFSGNHTTGTVAANVTKAVNSFTSNAFRPIIIATSTTGGNISYAGNTAVMVNPGRKTVAINGATEIGQTVSGTMLSISSEASYAAIALKSAGTGGTHFFQIIDGANNLRAMFREDGNAIFGSTSYANYGRATFIDDGFAGDPATGQLSSLCYFSQDDQNVYGWAIGNRTNDASFRKAAICAAAFNAGGGYVGTPDVQPLSLRTNNTDRLLIDGSGGVRVGSSTATPIQNVFSATATLDFPSIAINDTEQLTMTVTGAVAGDAVVLGAPSALETGLVAFGFVSAANTVAIRLHNTAGGAVNPASATWRATVVRF